MNENKTSCAPADNQQTLWDRIDWTKAELAVRKLQARIVKAQKEGRYNKVKALQWTLTHSFYAKALAVKRVTSNGGGNTPGVDMETWEKPEAKTQAISELKRRGYQPKPLRRVHIKKSNGKLRPLGIPTMKDRAMQALYLMALEPVSETTADSRSYGFRKERRCMDAVMQCHNILRKGYSPEWILEGDIKGCFDHISHEWLLANIPMDKAILRKWLKCGYIFNKQMFPTEEGTPQGGIISPTLANMTLDGLQKVLAEKYKRVRIKGKLYSPMVNLVRYADDFIITCENRETLEKEIKPLVADFMSERGLTLSEEKTVITNIRDGFDFLGFNIRKFGNEILTKPTKKAEKRFMENIRKVTKGHKGCKQESLIRMLNAKIRGWGAYYQHGATRDSFHRIDHQIFLALWQWAKRRHSKKGKQWIKDRYWHNIRGNSWTFAAKFKKSNGKEDQLTLLKLASSFPFLQYTQIKGDMNPFDADCCLYFNKRMKSKMLVTLKGRKSLLYLWEKQGRKCPICGEPIDTHKAWNVMPTVQDGRKCNLLVHDECFKLSSKKNGKQAIVIDLVNNNEILSNKEEVEYGYEINDIEALQQLIDWINNKNNGKLPEYSAEKSQKEKTMAKRMARINNKYLKYAQNQEMINELDKEEQEKIQDIIELGSEIGLFSEAIKLDLSDKEKRQEDLINQFTDGIAIKGVRKDFVKLLQERLREETFKEVMQFCEKNGRLPKHVVGTKATLTEEQIYEKNLYNRWIQSDERQLVDKYAGVPIEKIHGKCKAIVEQVRKYGYGIEEKLTTYQKVMQFCGKNGRLPKHVVGTKVTMTEEQLYESNLYARWIRSDEKKLVDKYMGVPIEEIPEEDRAIVEQVRSYGYLGNAKKSANSLGKAVGKAVTVTEIQQANEFLNTITQDKEKREEQE